MTCKVGYIWGGQKSPRDASCNARRFFGGSINDHLTTVDSTPRHTAVECCRQCQVEAPHWATARGCGNLGRCLPLSTMVKIMGVKGRVGACSRKSSIGCPGCPLPGDRPGGLQGAPSGTCSPAQDLASPTGPKQACKKCPALDPFPRCPMHGMGPEQGMPTKTRDRWPGRQRCAVSALGPARGTPPITSWKDGQAITGASASDGQGCPWERPLRPPVLCVGAQRGDPLRPPSQV